VSLSGPRAVVATSGRECAGYCTIPAFLCPLLGHSGECPEWNAQISVLCYAPPFSPVWDPLLIAASELQKDL